MGKELIFIEAENFENLGGWVIDQQSMDQMGSPYLLAHGLGIPVGDAATTIEIHEEGSYKVWVRTRNWVAPWGLFEPPGKFQVLINQKPLNTIFGTENKEWHWQNGGAVDLKAGKANISLHDLTGFDGRCDAVLLTNDFEITPPEERNALAQFRRIHSIFPEKPEDAGNEFDLVVVGGGIAGITTAISAARFGCTVALIHDRPVLGGNNSSEVRVGLSGLIYQEPYPNLGRLVDEIGSVGHWTLWEAKRNPDAERSKRILETIKKHPEKKIHNAGPASNYEDDKKRNVIESEENIKLFLNTHIIEAENAGNKISAVTGKNIVTGIEIKFRGRLFADCTGDATIGFLAGADYNTGRESKSETGENNAPQDADNLVMGTSVQWFAEEQNEPCPFPECPWALQFTEKNCQHGKRGDWNWETGFYKDQVKDIEYIRDYGFRAAYGNWAFLKNKSTRKEEYQNYKLNWMAYIGGKRESRRILGDVILKEQDIVNKVSFPDETFTTTWSIDLHYPAELEEFDCEPFLARAKMTKIEPYAVPYRCLYSRNIENLFMAGRNISVTHIALGTTRVQRTNGMMGEVVGMAASLCKENNILPREVYKSYLPELKRLLQKGVPEKES